MTVTDTETNQHATETTAQTGREPSAAQPVRRKIGQVERLIWLAAAAVYAPVVVETAHEWSVDERYSHGWLILPVCAGLVWMQRERLSRATLGSSWIGLPWIVVGLAAHLAAWFLRFPHIGIWSMVMVVSGLVLTLYGRAVWRIVRFPILFALFAGTYPNRLIEPVNLKIQSVSAAGAAEIMSVVGYTVMRSGNRIEIPGYVVEVADICSGYKKTIALLAFAFLYGYIMSTKPLSRVILCLSAFPIGAIANVGRVAALIAVTSAGGSDALHKAHDPAEIVSLVFAFLLFIALGKALGCRLPDPA